MTVASAITTELRRILSPSPYTYCLLALLIYHNFLTFFSVECTTIKVLKELLKFNQLLQLFITPELIVWAGIFKEYEKELRASTVFNSETRFGDLKKRVVEHNMRVMAKYYTRIRLERMSQLLDLSMAETEQTLSNLVASKVRYIFSYLIHTETCLKNIYALDTIALEPECRNKYIYILQCYLSALRALPIVKAV